MKTDNNLIPVLVCALAIFILSVMDAVMKSLVLSIGVYSTILWRCTLASVVAGAAWSAGPRIWPSPRVMRLHVLRAITVGCVLVLFFWGLARLPLAEAIALSFIAPLIALFMAALLLSERIRKAAIWASVGGMAGVAIIMAGQLGQSTYDEGALLGTGAVLVSTVFYAYNLILARQQALVAKPIEISFFQNLALSVVLGLAGPWLAVAAPVELWPGIAAATALSLSGILLMSWAYARAEAAAADSDGVYGLRLGDFAGLVHVRRNSRLDDAGRRRPDHRRLPDRRARQAGPGRTYRAGRCVETYPCFDFRKGMV